MKKYTLVFLFSVVLVSNCLSFNKDSIGIKYSINAGVTFGLTQHILTNTNVYLGGIFELKNKSTIEINSGLMFYSNKMNYNAINNIGYNSYGIYIAGNWALRSGLYVGALLQKDISIVNESSLEKYNQQTNKEILNVFTGSTFLMQLGYRKIISPKLGIRLQLQGGVHNYIIEVVNLRQEIYHTDFLATCNIGLYYQFNNPPLPNL